MTRCQRTEALWQWILDQWSGGSRCVDVDGCDLQDKAVDLGLLRVERYDPAIHGGDFAGKLGNDICIPVKKGGILKTNSDGMFFVGVLSVLLLLGVLAPVAIHYLNIWYQYWLLP